MDYHDEYECALVRPVKYSAKAFVHHITANPIDRTTRGAAADYLEENGLADDDTLHHLRHGDYPVWVHHEQDGSVRAGRKWTAPEIVQHFADKGHGYFSPQSRRSFGSRLSNRIHCGPGGVFFVESTHHTGSDREYHIHEFNPHPVENSARESMLPNTSDAFDNSRDAHALAHRLAHPDAV